MKVFKNTVLTGYDGKPMKLSQNIDGKIEIIDCSLVNALFLILNNAPLQTQNDSIQGMRLAQALDKAKESEAVELEEGTHDWLKPIAEKITPALFRVNGNLVYRHICEGFEKPKQPEGRE